tara:strand:- start:635555 stop:638395 length:2841 start_codon:yes stop_codon:yes gene_type:complete
MNRTASATPRSLNLPIGRLLLIALALCAAVISGCSNLRLPAIDPTGSRIFAPLPTTTTLALPGSAGERCGCFGCFSGIGRCLQNIKSGSPGFRMPQPAFPEPATPPACPTPAPIGSGASSGAINEPCVPSQSCNGACQNGPPAVLYDDECLSTNHHKLPKRGERGCILLSPQKIVAPVGGEVVLLSGICGTDGYLQVGQPLEWMLTPDSVGTFIQVGDDDPGVMHRLAKIKKAKKHDPSYALGVTSTKKSLITRGNLDPRDDVSLEKGQTWITLSSPSEGTSRVTVLAPESDCWDNRKATATIYWIDARWQFPSSQIVPAGTPVSLNTRVTRAEGSLPAIGWKVRYEIMDPSLASFAGTNGSSVVEVNVDDGGNAQAELLPVPGTSGITPIGIQVIRPGGVSDDIPTMTIGRGQTFVTWSSPQLAIRAGAPAVASFNVPVQVVANVSNPGDQPAENVRVTVNIPAGAKATSSDAFAQVLPNAIVWEIGTIPPRTELDVFMDVTLQQSVNLGFEARGEGLLANDNVRIDVFQPSISLSVVPEKDRYEAGQPATFNIDVKNTGSQPLQNLHLFARGDGKMVHEVRGTEEVDKPKEDGPLQPGDTWLVAVTFVPTESGRRCIDVRATADGGQQATSQSCVTVINPVPPTPALTATLEGRQRYATGDTALFRSRIANTGEVPLRDVRVTMSYDPQLDLTGATERGLRDARSGQYLVEWLIPSLPPGSSEMLEAQFSVLRTNPRSTIVLTSRAAEGATADETFTFEIVQGAPPSPLSPSDRDAAPSLPPALPPPSIPSGPAPIPAAPELGGTAPVAPPLATTPTRSGKIQYRLDVMDNPVRVGEPIRYRLRVVNDSDRPDGWVGIRFVLPDGVSISRAVQRESPQAGEFTMKNGMAYLADIRTMRPGEEVNYELVLVSNQAQTFPLNVEIVSQNNPDPMINPNPEIVTVIP